MRKYIGAFLVGIIALAPVVAAAQTGSGSGASGSSGSGSGNTAPGGSGSPSTAPSTAPSTSPSTAPSASPSGMSGDFAQYTSQMDCEKAGGMWQAASSKCEKKQ